VPEIADYEVRRELADDKEMADRFWALVEAFSPWRDRVAQGDIGNENLAEWFISIEWISVTLSQAFDFPQGAERLALFERLRGELNDLHNVDVGATVQQRVEAITEALEHTLEVGRRKLLDQVEISARLDPSIVDGRKAAEVTLFLRNEGTLLLSLLRVQTEPEQGDKRFKFLRVGEEVSLSVTIPPRLAGTYPLTGLSGRRFA
jgi:hypothetical protein